MKFRELPTLDQLRSEYSYNKETGLFTSLVKKGRWAAGRVCGTRNAFGHVLVSIGGTQYLAHRLAWLMVTETAPEYGVDHRNGIPDDNRWDNIREANQSQNAGNKRGGNGTATGVKGVYPNKGGFMARIEKRGTVVYLGTYPTIAEAKAAYDAAAKIAHGDFFRS